MLQNEWDDRKKKLEEDTKALIAAGKEALDRELKDGKVDLKQLQTQIDSLQQAFKHDKSVLDRHIKKAEDNLAGLDHERQVLTEIIHTLQDDKRSLDSEITVLSSQRDDLTAQKQQLASERTDLEAAIVSQNETYEDLDKQIKRKKVDLKSITEQHTETVAQNEHEITVLESKKQAIIQEAAETKQSMDQVRDNLAAWQKKLEEQDKNLRIREEKANQQEKTIARNYNLLNL